MVKKGQKHVYVICEGSLRMISKMTFKIIFVKNWVVRKFESFLAKNKSLNFPGLQMRSHRPMRILNVSPSLEIIEIILILCAAAKKF